MRRFFRCSPIYYRSAALSIFLLMSCSEQAQDVDCNQVTGLFAIADWQTLAAEPFVEKKRDQSEVVMEAPAKNLITGFDNCKISRTQFSQDKFSSEMFTYLCKAPISTADGDDLLNAAKAVAARWKPCLAGWSERSEFRKLPIGDLATVTFSSDEYKGHFVTISRSCVGLCKKGGFIAFLFGRQRDPVEVTITKFIRK